MVEVDHGYGLETRYAHMSRWAVRVGQSVKRGDLLGYVGSTGLSTGPHLHYEVRVNGRAVDPLRYILPDAIAD
jgi:murein DD-endopeptidase MepM/ murein hydrolase activator NlpD